MAPAELFSFFGTNNNTAPRLLLVAHVSARSQNIAHMDLSRLIAVAVLLGALRPLLSHCAGDVEGLHPLVLVPGYGSNLLEARLTAAYEPPAPGCGKGNGWFRLWPIKQTAMQDPRQVPCFVDQMSLVYDAVADDYGNVAGVVTRVPLFGSTRGLIGWDPLLRELEAAGYRDGESLFAVPYDFRYSVAPRGHPSAEGACNFDEFTRLVERASSLSQGRPVVVAAHSFGCALTYQFLLGRPLAWRRRFVKRVVFVASALGGFSEGMNDLAAGTDYGLPNVARPARVRLARSQQSALWRLPTPAVFGDRPLVVTKNATYTAHNIAEFFEAVGFPEGVRPYVTRVLPAWEALPAPMVPVTSIIGVGVSTPETFVYGEDGFAGTPEVVYGDGDGDINMVSLVAIEKEWSGVEGQVLTVVRLPGVRHDGFFSVGFALEKVVAEILEAAGTIELHPKIGRVQIDAGPVWKEDRCRVHEGLYNASSNAFLEVL
ncbi:lecithin-cholesterol acyltransferase-like 1 [Triticum dicoccoides]|uniref:lecithin-cholesterol acyltransferase-like 1 n=1 Tax=Triticum dicoccoides TaxID=85692 RepID=UPI00162C3C4B|nr:lecithin-cholesterol acyltransferase-like 1 [Triticum dicoccoides]